MITFLTIQLINLKIAKTIIYTLILWRLHASAFVTLLSNEIYTFSGSKYKIGKYTNNTFIGKDENLEKTNLKFRANSVGRITLVR